MRKIKLYVAMSLNGMIAKADGQLEWLETMPNPDNSDYGFKNLYDSIDTTIQGYSTYKLILDRGIEMPTKDKTNYVFTRKTDIADEKYVQFVKQDHINFTIKLKQQKGKDIWLLGGGQINTLLFNEDLIDEIQVFVMPIVIETGIKLFEHIPKEKMITLEDTVSYKSGVVELKYSVKSN